MKSFLSKPDLQLLPSIPFANVETGGARELVRLFPEHAAGIVRSAHAFYPKTFFKVATPVSRRFLRGVPYESEILEIAEMMGDPDIVALNLSYEWGCTSGVASSGTGLGCTMFRILDWALPGLGKYLVVAQQRGPAGSFYNITWPGFVGLIQGFAPGRFAIAINLPPMHRYGAPLFADWVINRFYAFKRGMTPPAYLLRQVFETCKTYAEAVDMLVKTPLCVPAFYTVCGLDEGCIIEREERTAHVHQAPTAIANKWVDGKQWGRARGGMNMERRGQMMSLVKGEEPWENFSWVHPPCLKHDIRLSMTANIKENRFIVQGWEVEMPVTQIFTHGL